MRRKIYTRYTVKKMWFLTKYVHVLSIFSEVQPYTCTFFFSKRSVWHNPLQQLKYDFGICCRLAQTGSVHRLVYLSVSLLPEARNLQARAWTWPCFHHIRLGRRGCWHLYEDLSSAQDWVTCPCQLVCHPMVVWMLESGSPSARLGWVGLQQEKEARYKQMHLNHNVMTQWY